MDRDGVVQWLVGDHLVTTSLVLKADGTVHSEARHYPYGEERWSSGTLPTYYRFTGQRSDSYVKLVHMGARFYDPALGRWLSADTIVPDPANPQEFNRYAYVGGNPLGYVDPTGHARYGGDDYDPADQPDVAFLWDPDWLNCVGDSEAAEQAFLLFLTDPWYFIALYADTAAWNASQEVANLEVFAEYSILHTSAADLLLNGFDPDTAAGLREAHFLGGLGTEEGSNAFAALAGVGVAKAAIGGDASTAINGILLNRSLASLQQMGESGHPIAGAGTLKELRVAKQLAVDYGGSPDDWAKMVSSSYRGPNDHAFQTHWYENTKTGLRVEWKTKLTGGWWRERR
jgi:RHS repeat-associated protein